MKCTLCLLQCGHLVELCSKTRFVHTHTHTHTYAHTHTCTHAHTHTHTLIVSFSQLHDDLLNFLQLVDYRVEFSKWWQTEFKIVKFPVQGTVFDYYINPQTRKWTSWAEKVPKYSHDPEMPLQVSMKNYFSIIIIKKTINTEDQPQIACCYGLQLFLVGLVYIEM